METKVGWIHPVMTLVIQMIVGLITHNWWLGGLIASTWFCSREQSQAEYRAIALHGGKRANIKWYQVYDPKIWTWHSITDCVLPIVVAAGVYVAVLFI